MGSRTDASAARQALRRLAERLSAMPEEVLRVRGDVLAASLSKTHKVCGKPNCRCAQGDKHVVHQLSWSEDGKRRSAHVRADELSNVRAAVVRYRRLRRCRAQLLKSAAEGAALIDALVDALRVPPPDNSRGGQRSK